MQKESTINRRAFIALGATAATGLAKAQSLVVKRRIKKGEGNPLSDVVKPAGEEVEAAIRTLEETTMSDEEKRAAAFPVVQREIDHMLDDLSCKDAAQNTMPAKMFVPVHHQELGHLGGKYRCVGFEDEPLKIVRSLREAGYKAAMPVWGDRIV